MGGSFIGSLDVRGAEHARTVQPPHSRPLCGYGNTDTCRPGKPAASTRSGNAEAVPLVNKTVGQLLMEQKEKLEHKDLLIVPQQTINFTHIEVDKYVRAWGNGLPDAKVRRKPAPATPDRVLSLLLNDAENVRIDATFVSSITPTKCGGGTIQLVTQLGTMMAGRIVVPASPQITAKAGDVECVGPDRALPCERGLLT